MCKQAVSSLKILVGIYLFVSSALLWAQAPIVSRAIIGPSGQETGATDPFPSPYFGETVAISDDTAMASIPGELASEPNEFGRVAVFERKGTAWERSATLLGTEEAAGFGRSIDIEGDRAVIAGSKAIYLYERRGKQWMEAAKVVARDETWFFGGGVDLEDGQIAARVYQQQEGVVTASFVNIYRKKAPGVLATTAVIRQWTESPSSSFGVSLAMDGKLLVIGAPNGNDELGSAYVYARVGHHWFRMARLTASDATVGDGFGTAVAIRKNVIVIGAPGADLGIVDPFFGREMQGNVYVFQRYGRGWSESQKINDASDPYPVQGIGEKVSIGNGLLAVFAPAVIETLRSEDQVLMYDWVDRSFQFGRQVERYNGYIPDLDMSGRRLISSQHDRIGSFNYYTFGRAEILTFGRNADVVSRE